LRQRSDAQPHAVEQLEARREVGGDDRDEAGRKPALRNEGGLRARGELDGATPAADVLGQVEIVGACRARGLADRPVGVERRGVEDGKLAGEQREKVLIVFDIQMGSADAVVLADALEGLQGTVRDRHVVIFGGDQQVGDRRADLAGTDDHHLAPGPGGSLHVSIPVPHASLPQIGGYRFETIMRRPA
jgi:hypothetical protein